MNAYMYQGGVVGTIYSVTIVCVLYLIAYALGTAIVVRQAR